MKVKKPETQIAIIGATQSGKTTLAAGLAKTSDKDFTVGFNNKLTEEYLQPRIAGIAAGHWPEPTNEEDKDICLKLNTLGGRTALISFKEYKGERIQDENYLEQIVGKPNGALILLNPGMDLLQDPEQCEKLIGYLKGIVDHLKVNKCVAVAFVVTACDRLKTDLKDFAEKFENCAAEVTNYLNTSGMNWSRFDVTITGELDDQKKPSIAVGDKNTAREPFLWIMDRVAGRKRMTVTKRIANLSGCCLLAGLMAFGVFRLAQWHSEKSEVAACEAAVAQIENRINSATVKRSEDDLNCATDDLAALITSNQTFVCRFKGQQQRLETDMQSWSNLYDKARSQYLSVSMDKREEKPADRGSETDCKEFDDLLEKFSPSDADIKIDLTNRWTKLRPKIREGYDVAKGKSYETRLLEFRQKEKSEESLGEVCKFKDEVSQWITAFESSGQIKTNVLAKADAIVQEIGEELDERAGYDCQQKIDNMASMAATSATPAALEKLRQDIANWSPNTQKGISRKEQIEYAFGQNSPKWKRSYLDNACKSNANVVVRKVQGFNPNNALESAAIRETLLCAYNFTNQFSQATSNVLADATNRIYGACATFLEKLSDSVTNKWNAADREAPQISDKEFIKDALDLPNPDNPKEKLHVEFLDRLEQARKIAEKNWREQQKEKVEEYIGVITNMTAVDMFDATRKDSYRRWYGDNAGNPFVTNVDSVVEQAVSKYFDNYVKEFRRTFHIERSAFKSDGGKSNARNQFTQFKNLCLALATDPCGIKRTWCFKFAEKCKNVGHIEKGMDKAFSRNFHITELKAKLHIEDSKYRAHKRKLTVLQCRRKCSGDDQNERIAYGEFSDEDFHLIEKGICLETNPWSNQLIGISGKIVNFFANDNVNQWFYLSPYDEDYCKTGYFEFSFRQSSGGGILDWYVCTVRISGVFEGTDIFNLYNDCKCGK